MNSPVPPPAVNPRPPTPASAAAAPAPLEVRGLCCVRGDRVLFADLHFAAPAGSIVLLTGPNGSGKTSLLRILCGLLRAEAGEVRWRGRSTAAAGPEWLAEVTHLGHEDGLKADLSLAENFTVAQALGAGEPWLSPAAAAERLGLGEHLHSRVSGLSAGQRRRAALATLLLARAALWLLDEPFTAVDAEGQQVAEALLREQLEGDGIIVMSSHATFSDRALRSRARELRL